MTSSDPSPLASAELLRRLHSGDEAAATELFQRYAQRLTQLARSRLAARLAARMDAEDVVMSAYRSFFVAARDGRFSIEKGGDLWRLLVEITLHKLYRSVNHHQALRRNLQRDERSTNEPAITELISREPTPDQAAAAAEELEALLLNLPDTGRRILELRLQGYEHEEIAASLNCNERTVRRWLNEARRIMVARAGGNFVPSAARRHPTVATRPQQDNSAELQLDAPLSWGDFTLQQQIGAGATGKVYRAVQKCCGSAVAIKFLKKSLLGRKSVVAQFLREVRTVAQLNHPGIVRVQGAGRTPGGGLFLAMDLIRGRDLDRVRREASVEPAHAAAWIAAAAETIDRAHQCGVVHCDLKPSNLLLDESGRIHITDFGLAIHMSDVATGALAGTPAFMAPEQVDACWGPVSPRTDVWGLGATLYFLLFGESPHAGHSVAEALARVVSRTPVSLPASATSHLPQSLLKILLRCLTKSPAERFPTAQQVHDALGL